MQNEITRELKIERFRLLKLLLEHQKKLTLNETEKELLQKRINLYSSRICSYKSRTSKIRNYFTNQEIQFMKDNYPTRGAKYCADFLGRTIQSIQAKANVLGIRFILTNDNVKDNHRICSRCKQEKSLLEFHINNGRSEGRGSYCRPCQSIIHKEYRVTHKKEIRISKINYRPKRNLLRRQRYKIDETQRKQISQRAKRWRKQNIDYIKQEKYDYYHKTYKYRLSDRRKTEPAFRLIQNTRARIKKVLRGKFKSDKSINLLGCSAIFYKKYLTSKFSPQMTWEIYLKGHIEIDHIRPCYSFKLESPEEQHKCFHYTNTQPLWKDIETARKYGDFASQSHEEKTTKDLEIYPLPNSVLFYESRPSTNKIHNHNQTPIASP